MPGNQYGLDRGGITAKRRGSDTTGVVRLEFGSAYVQPLGEWSSCTFADRDSLFGNGNPEVPDLPPQCGLMDAELLGRGKAVPLVAAQDLVYEARLKLM